MFGMQLVPVEDSTLAGSVMLAPIQGAFDLDPEWEIDPNTLIKGKLLGKVQGLMGKGFVGLGV